MRDIEIEFRLEGPLGESQAMDLYALIESQIGVKPRVERAPNGAPDQPVAKDLALTVGIVSLVVTIPGAVFNAIQLVEWFQKRRREKAEEPVGASGIRVAIRGSGDGAFVEERDVRILLERMGQAAANTNSPRKCSLDSRRGR